MKRSKWELNEILEKNEELLQYIPETRWLNQENLAEMLDTYGMVYVKPDNWTWGRGVIKVEKGQGGISLSNRKKNVYFLSILLI